MPGIRLYGPDAASPQRVSTFAVDVAGKGAREVAIELGRRGIYVWDGHYYAIGAMDQLGLLETGGLVRIGLVHYTSADEVDRVLEALEELAPVL